MKGSRSSRPISGSARNIEVVGGSRLWITGGAAPSLDPDDLGIDLRHDLLRDLVLQRQQVVRLAIEPLRPDDLVAGTQVEQAKR